MRNLEGESDRGLLRAFFDRRLKFEFTVRGSRQTLVCSPIVNWTKPSA